MCFHMDFKIAFKCLIVLISLSACGTPVRTIPSKVELEDDPVVVVFSKIAMSRVLCFIWIENGIYISRSYCVRTQKEPRYVVVSKLDSTGTSALDVLSSSYSYSASELANTKDGHFRKTMMLVDSTFFNCSNKEKLIIMEKASLNFHCNILPHNGSKSQ